MNPRTFALLIPLALVACGDAPPTEVYERLADDATPQLSALVTPPEDPSLDLVAPSERINADEDPITIDPDGNVTWTTRTAPGYEMPLRLMLEPNGTVEIDVDGNREMDWVCDSQGCRALEPTVLSRDTCKDGECHSEVAP